MNKKDLNSKHYGFGNKGAVNSNMACIHKSGDFSGSLCGIPGLSSNYVQIWDHQTLECPKCLQLYNEQNPYSLDSDNYKVRHATIADLIDHVMSSGMDPSYIITKHGEGTGETAFDLMVE